MILVCPSCEAKFKVPDGAIPPDGRTVRCAKCKHSWRALPDQILARPAAPAAPAPARPVAPRPVSPPPEMDAGMAARAAAVRRTVQDDPAEYAPPPSPIEDDIYDDDGDVRPAQQGSSKVASDDFGVSAALKANFGAEFDDDDHSDDHEHGDGDDEQYDEDDFLARRRAEQRRQAERDATARKRKLLTALWGALLVFWLVVLYLLVFKKDEVVYKMPGMAGFYEMFEGVSDVERFQPEEGEEVSTPLGETEVYVSANLYGHRSGVETVDGRPTLVVRGYIQNTSKTRSATVPQVRVDVLDSRKRVLTSWVVDPPGRILRRGAILNFESSLYPIPSGTANAAVSVIEGSRSTAEVQTP